MLAVYEEVQATTTEGVEGRGHVNKHFRQKYLYMRRETLHFDDLLVAEMDKLG